VRKEILVPPKAEIAEVLQKTESYLTDVLLPFWMDRSVDRQYGGFLPYFDRHGRPTGETAKTFLAQIRMLYAMSSTHRAGYGGGRCAELAKWAADFLLNHFWDDRNEGWIWIADRAGQPTFSGKVGYGQVFGLYAFSEYFLATGDVRGREAAERTYASICKNMTDVRHGGLFELFQPDWQVERPGKYGGDRKSLDVHMHAMEALTTYYEMTARPAHRRHLLEIIDLLLTRMIDPQFGTGYIQFTPDFTPLRAIMFAVDWGRDAPPEDGLARPLDYTSYGHNVEFAWLLLHAADVLGLPRDTYREAVRKIFDHCVRFGLDWDYGGVLTEGPQNAPPTLTEKQFWQQAEVLVGLLDACAMFPDEQYWKAFRNVHDFVFNKFIYLPGGGEWFERLARDGTPIDDALGHGWKVCYHTMRSMVQTVARLRRLSQ
jgi:mannobiose 2-epimerase